MSNLEFELFLHKENCEYYKGFIENYTYPKNYLECKCKDCFLNKAKIFAAGSKTKHKFREFYSFEGSCSVMGDIDGIWMANGEIF